MSERMRTISRSDRTAAASDATEISRILNPERLKKTHKVDHRPPFDCIAFLLQGGGALGSYQASV